MWGFKLKQSSKLQLNPEAHAYEELKQQYDRDVSDLKAQLETSKKDLEDERQANSDSAKKELERIYKLKYEAVTKEFQTLQQTFTKITKDLKCNLAQCESSHNSLLQQVKKLHIERIQETKAHLEDMVLLKKMKVLNAKLQEDTVKEIQVLQEREREAQSELEKMKDSYQVLQFSYKTDVHGHKVQLEIYETELESERKANSDRAMKDLEEMEKLREEQEYFYQTMTKEVKILQSGKDSLQEELDQVKHSYTELEQKYETDVSGLKDQLETSKKDLEDERQASSDQAKKDLDEMIKLKEQEDQYESMTKEVKILQSGKDSLQEELDQVKHSYEELEQKYDTDVSGLKAQLETSKKDLEDELEQMKDSYQVLQCKYETDVAALKEELEKHQQSLERNINLERENEDLELGGSLTDEKEDLHQQTPQNFADCPEEEEEIQPEHVEVLHQDVSPEEDFSEKPSSGSSTYLESRDFAAGSIQEDLEKMKDGKRKKPKVSIWKRMQRFMGFKKSKKERKA